MNIFVVRFRLVIPAVLALLAMQSCEDDPVKSDTPKPRLNGSIVRSNGAPLDSAEVVLLFHTDLTGDLPAGGQFVTPNPATTSAALHFSVPAANTFVAARILDPLIGTVAAAPVSFVAAAGEHTVEWNLKQHPDSARTIRNGWYTVRLDVGGEVRDEPLLINSENSTAFAISDSLGRFFIDYRYIPSDSTTARIDETGTILGQYAVTDSVTVVVRRKGYATQRKTIGIDRLQSMNVKFTF